ncbi:protein CHUP1, chloroplastic [Telopea speciosissima]|uniref:protein CHUP1, chloroplastic n=1 Tax=Telopea speciosissima TaxID=54955 RepID=UPI001CC3798F|nr:protein CHUP1, chloroplastic [Telopea speciosissima]
MKQEISTTAAESKSSFSQSTTPSRLRASSKVKDSLKSDVSNGLSPGLKARPKTVPPDPNNSQKVRKSLGLNKLKSPEDVVGSQRGREGEDVKIMGRTGKRTVVEQFARPRRGMEPSSKRIEDDTDGKRKELQEKLHASENSVKDLQSEICTLKSQLEKLRSLNVELESQNRQFANDLAAAEAKISALESRQQEPVEEEFQSHDFKKAQKLIGNKLENLRVGETIKEGSTVKIPSVAPQRAPVSSNPPPPPPPPPRVPARAASMHKAPTLVQFYHSLTKHEGKKDPLRHGNHNSPTVSNVHSSIVGEIQNRSAHLLAIKADVETKGEFIKFLIQKVQDAIYTDIEDVLKFVDWLDNKLSSLADERAVLKNFNWPEKKADALREAAVEYRDLKRLESEVSSYKDDNTIPCEVSLKKMASLLDKSERNIQRLVKLREAAIPFYRDWKVPTDWMLDSGMVNKIKQGSMKLAKMYMKRVSSEIESVQNSERESMQEALLLQGVHFAYRAHQFAGGLDSETMCAFEEIKQRMPVHMGGHRQLFAGIASS